MFEVTSDEEFSFPLISRTFGRRLGKAWRSLGSSHLSHSQLDEGRFLHCEHQGYTLAHSGFKRAFALHKKVSL